MVRGIEMTLGYTEGMTLGYTDKKLCYKNMVYVGPGEFFELTGSRPGDRLDERLPGALKALPSRSVSEAKPQTLNAILVLELLPLIGVTRIVTQRSHC